MLYSLAFRKSYLILVTKEQIHTHTHKFKTPAGITQGKNSTDYIIFQKKKQIYQNEFHGSHHKHANGIKDNIVCDKRRINRSKVTISNPNNHHPFLVVSQYIGSV